MKKTQSNKSEQDEMLPEYRLAGKQGVRGKHHRALQAGYTITIHKADGATVVKEVLPKEGAIVLEPDVQEYFPDSEAVNSALRSLIQLIPAKRAGASKKTQSAAASRRLVSGRHPKSTGKTS